MNRLAGESIQDLQRRISDSDLPMPVIAGQTMTTHAFARMLQRQIHADHIQDAIRRPVKRAPGTNGCWKVWSDLASVTYNPALKVIVTVGFGVLNPEKKVGLAGVGAPARP